MCGVSDVKIWPHNYMESKVRSHRPGSGFGRHAIKSAGVAPPASRWRKTPPTPGIAWGPIPVQLVICLYFDALIFEKKIGHVVTAHRCDLLFLLLIAAKYSYFSCSYGPSNREKDSGGGVVRRLVWEGKGVWGFRCSGDPCSRNPGIPPPKIV